MNLLSRLVVHRCGAGGDFGSLLFIVADEQHAEHTIELIQHAYNYTKNPKRISGRLYFDDEIVPIWSDHEAAILMLLRNAEIFFTSGGMRKEEFDDDLRKSVKRVIEYIESAEYLAFAAEQEAPDQ